MEVESVGVHDITKEIREWRAEPAVEEHDEERIPGNWSCLRGDGGEYLRARMRPRLRRPEEIVPLPQLLRGELRGESGPLLPQRLKPLRFGRLHSFRGRSLRGLPFPGFGGMAEAVGEIDGTGGSDGGGSGALLSFDYGSGRGRRRFLRLQQQMAKIGKIPLFPLLIRGTGRTFRPSK